MNDSNAYKSGDGTDIKIENPVTAETDEEYDRIIRSRGKSPQAVREVISIGGLHQRRIIQEGTGWNEGGGIEHTQLFQYCVACAHYQAGGYADLAVAWIEHIKEVNGE